MGLFFNWNDGDIGFSLSDKWGIDSNGDFKIKLFDHTIMDFNTGDIEFISGWDDEE